MPDVPADVDEALGSSPDLSDLFVDDEYGTHDLVALVRGKPKPGYSHIRVVTPENPGEELLRARLGTDDQARLDALRKTKDATQRASRTHHQKNGTWDAELQTRDGAAERDYWEFYDALMARPGNEDLKRPVHRGELDVSPPGPKKGEKDPLGAPLPAITAHNKSVVGEDETSMEYCAASGIVPMPCYDMSDAKLTYVVEHLAQCLDHYRTPIWVDPATPIKQVRILLSRRDDDCAVFVRRGEEFVGALGARHLKALDAEHHAKGAKDFETYDDQPVSRFMTPTRDLHIQKEGITPPDAWQLMKQKQVGFFPIDCKDGKIRIMSKMDAANGMVNKPFKNPNGGLGFMMSIGINRNGKAPWGDPLKRVQEYRSRIHGWMADTAHMDRPDAMAFLRAVAEAAPHNPKAAGTTISPAGTRRILGMGYNYVKSGIGGGTQCMTTTTATGIGLPSAYAHYTNGLAAASMGGALIGDGGVNNYATFCKSLSMPGVSYDAAGTWLAPVRESAAPYHFDAKGNPYKLVGGEAGMLRVTERLLAQIELDCREEVMLYLGPHAEGTDQTAVYPEPWRDTFTQKAYGIRTALQSFLSYLHARNLWEAKEKARYVVIAA